MDTPKDARTQDYYDRIKNKFAEERDLRLKYRPEGTAQYTSELTGELAHYEIDPYADDSAARDPITDTVECLFIGGGFSALLTAARLREHGVESIRIVERGGGCRRHLVLEPLSGRGLRRAVLRLPAAAGRNGIRAVAASTPRGRKSSPTARRSRAATTSTTWPCSARR